MNVLIAENPPLTQEDFASDLFQRLDPANIPRHIAIIMDGNRRWARKRGMPAFFGHRAGASNLHRIVQAAANAGIKVVTVYSFSTENWNRSAAEVYGLFHIFKIYLRQKREEMIAQGVRLQAIGDLSRLPKDVLLEVEEARKATSHCCRIELVLALNYGGRDDIRRAAISLLEDFTKGKIAKEAVSEEMFASYLDTASWGDPDLFIRTSGEWRISNFLLWQLSYSEVYITDVLWPDFDERQLLLALEDYQQRERRLGQK